jgi:cell cycle related kinase
MDSENVLRLFDVFPQGLGIVLVFEFMATDLSELIRDSERPLKPAQSKTYLRMLLRGTAYLHDRCVMHRDLKPANLLIR